jgi:hypothetical protein
LATYKKPHPKGDDAEDRQESLDWRALSSVALLSSIAVCFVVLRGKKGVLRESIEWRDDTKYGSKLVLWGEWDLWFGRPVAKICVYQKHVIGNMRYQTDLIATSQNAMPCP